MKKPILRPAFLGADQGEHVGLSLVGLGTKGYDLLYAGQFLLTRETDKRALRDRLGALKSLCQDDGWDLLGLVLEENPFLSAHHRGTAEGRAIERGQARWAEHLRVHCWYAGIPIAKAVNNQTARRWVCGNGHADKSQVMRAMQMRYRLPADFFPDESHHHMADAMVLATAGLYRWQLEQQQWQTTLSHRIMTSSRSKKRSSD